MLERQVLHAARIAFEHPITKESLEITAPMPDDMKGLIKEEISEALDSLEWE